MKEQLFEQVLNEINPGIIVGTMLAAQASQRDIERDELRNKIKSAFMKYQSDILNMPKEDQLDFFIWLLEEDRITTKTPEVEKICKEFL